ALILHWDGTAWSIVPGAAALESGTLIGITAITANDIWAVGWFFSSITSQTLTLHWDGVTWNLVPSPSVGTRENSLWGVGAHSSNDVWAVGFSSSNASPRR